ncbi:hypothetical protein ACFPTO_01525 [Paraburkholderia denitrificans]|uniref:Uncharacterized protein n=1 Tax=Paraburkholderia denitrificans TaxID=694025 RepID=A0ABW0J386_9BURK
MQTRKLGRAAITSVLASSIGAFAQGVPQPDLPGSDPHWIKLTVGGQDCRTFDPNPVPGEHVTWTGGCSHGLTSGAGTETWYHPNGTLSGTDTGTMVDGYLEGRVTQDKMENGMRRHDVAQFVHGIQNGYATLETYDSSGRIVERDTVYLINNLANGAGSKILYRADGTISQQYTGPFENGHPISGQRIASTASKNTPTNSQQSSQGAPTNASKVGFTFMGIKLGVPIEASAPKCTPTTPDNQMCWVQALGIIGLFNPPDIGFTYSIGILPLNDDVKNPIYVISIKFTGSDYSDVVSMFAVKYGKPTSIKKNVLDVNGEERVYMSPKWDIGGVQIDISLEDDGGLGIIPVAQIIDKKLNSMQNAENARQKEKQIQGGASKF